MAKMALNFASPPRSRLPGLVALAIALLLATQALNARSQLLDAIADQQALQQRLERQIHARLLASPSPATISDPKADQSVRQIAAALNQPWDELLNALQQAGSNDILLQKIQPDAKTRLVQLNGHATNADALMHYLSTLEKDRHWAQVQPLSEDMDSSVAGKPLSFTLSALWVQP